MRQKKINAFQQLIQNLAIVMYSKNDNIHRLEKIENKTEVIFL